MTGCLRNSSSKVKGLKSDLVVSGQVLDSAGTPQKDVLVYVESAQSAAATTDDQGKFSITFLAEHLDRLKYKVPYQREVFYIYFEKSAESGRLAAVSPFIEVVERGTLSLETITLRPAIDVQGKVSLLPSTGSTIPAAGATVQIGRVSAVSRADGSYTLGGITAGKVPFIVSAKGYEPFIEEWDTAEAGFLQKSSEIMLFADSSVSGIVVSQEARTNLVLITSGHPFERSFSARGSAKTRFIRYHHDKGVLLGEMVREQGALASKDGQAVSALNPASPTSMDRAPWHPVADEVKYDFAGVGGYVLYYQFADSAQTEISPIYQIAIAIDLFSDTTGLKLDDGALTTSDPKVKVSIDLPAAAVSMRLSESLEGLKVGAWLTPEALTTWQFPAMPSVSSGGITSALGAQSEARNLYIQFLDAYKNESSVYSATIRLELFPLSEKILVGDGSGFVHEANPVVTLTPPPRAVAMRISDTVSLMNDAFWMDVKSSFRFSLTSGTDTVASTYSVMVSPILVGPHSIYVQFLDDAGYVSNVYSQEFTVELFPSDGIPFMIEGGVPSVPYRTVLLSIDVPVNSYEMRIFEPTTNGMMSAYGYGAAGTIGVSSTTNADTIDMSRYWIRSQSVFIYTFRNDGTKELLLQFRDMNGNISPTYKRSIRIQPFEPEPGVVDFIIGDGTGVTTNPDQLVQINVPPSASYMVIADEEENLPDRVNNNWQIASPIAKLHVKEGRSVYTLRFRSIDGVMSHVLQKVIRYEPFPQPETVVVINDGDASTIDNKINLKFTLPITAVKMRVSRDEAALESMPYDDLQIAAVDTLPTVPGIYHEYVQMILIDGSETDVFSDSIELKSQFPVPTGKVVIIDGDAATTTLSTVNVAIDVPVAAKFMRICECSLSDLALLPYTETLTSKSITFADPAAGTKTVYVQFKAENGEESTYYLDDIVKI